MAMMDRHRTLVRNEPHMDPAKRRDGFNRRGLLHSCTSRCTKRGGAYVTSAKAAYRRHLPLAVTVAIMGSTACDGGDPLIQPLACDIVLRPEATLGKDAEAAGPSGASEVIRSNGLYFVSGTYSPGTVSVFDSGGRLLHTIGRRGSGPGEHQHVTKLAAVDDTLYIYDRVSRKISKYTADGHYLASIPAMTGYTPFTALPGGGLILLSNTRQPGPATFELVKDTTIASFVLRNESTAAGEKMDMVLVPQDEETFWVGSAQRYLVERVNMSGRRHVRIAPDAAWFPPPDAFRSDRTLPDSLTVVAGLAVDRLGRLVMLTVTRALDRSTGVRDAADRVSTPSTWHARLHVFDSSTGDRIAEFSDRESRYRGLADGQHIYALDALHDGTPVVRMSRIYLVKPNTLEGCQ